MYSHVTITSLLYYACLSGVTYDISVSNHFHGNISTNRITVDDYFPDIMPGCIPKILNPGIDKILECDICCCDKLHVHVHAVFMCACTSFFFA